MASRQHQDSLRWLHRVSRLMLQGRRQARLKDRKGVPARRNLQRQQLLKTIMDGSPMPPEGWLSSKPSGALFWRALRWGGPGIALGWWLSQH